eukprot:TRINITY_DN12807_c0_g1_i1.p1 TRINITY_DN12807_c0_g1~~TRINITY_DN12807_c0_g1_i1.p1  ORF type:complete len:177 (+),score=54.83 TRINITY_DN12807_c0_g1_i1:45-575(+)
MAEVELGEGDAVEAYWPDSDEWLSATLTTVHEDGSLGVTWEDGCVSDVPADYVRAPALVEAQEAPEEVGEEEVINEEVEEEEVVAEEESAALPHDDSMDALLAAAEAAGACDEADEFVADSKPPCTLYWADNLEKKAPQRETAADARKRLRPLGLMNSSAAKTMVLEAKDAKKARR